MLCNCGYSFSQGALKRKRGFKSYALINDAHYDAFLRAEMKILKEKRDSGEQMAAIARASLWVGSAMECPQCGRLLVLKPSADPGPMGPFCYKLEPSQQQS